MRVNLFSVLLLPAAITASFLPVMLVESDTPTMTTTSPSSKQTASNPSLNQAFGPQAHIDLRAAQPEPTAPMFAVHAPHIPRAYDPNPNLLNLAFNAAPEALDKREVVTGAAAGVAVTAAVGPTQVPSVTTYWPQVKVNGQATYIPVTYTQTFPEVPDQLPSPGAGRIGY